MMGKTETYQFPIPHIFFAMACWHIHIGMVFHSLLELKCDIETLFYVHVHLAKFKHISPTQIFRK